ncbi:TPA: hypothetical protein ACW7MP_003723 [Enterobacter hormaechei]
MIVPFAKVYNASSLWLPPDDVDGIASVVFEPPVNFSHSSLPFSFIRANASTIAFSGW